MRVIAHIGGLAPIGVMAPGCDQKHEKEAFNCIFGAPSGLSHRCDNPDIKSKIECCRNGPHECSFEVTFGEDQTLTYQYCTDAVHAFC